MSNLLDKASIVTTPTAYENGKILSVKPSIVLGNELVVNGTFDDGLNGWNINSNALGYVSASSNSLQYLIGHGDYAEVKQLNNSVIGKTYKGSFEVISKGTNADVFIQYGRSFIYSGSINNLGLGIHTFEVVSVNPDGFSISVRTNGIIEINNVSVKEAIDADFDFTRNSSATRVNSQGLIEDMQILSGDLVSNGDFSQEGSELVTNGDFATDSDWNLGQGQWTITGGFAVALSNAGNILHTSAAVASSNGLVHKVVFTLSDVTSGYIRVGLSNPATQYSANGTYTVYIESSANNYLYFRPYGFTGKISNVSVKEVGQDWTLGTGWSIANGKATSDASVNSYLNQTLYTIGNLYKLKFEVLEGVIELRSAQYSKGTGFYTTGIHEIEVIPTTASTYFYVYTGFGQSSITNISVIEITEDTNLPRIDYTGGVGHWLFEQQRTNLLDYSNDFSQSYWTKQSGVTATYNTTETLSPDGTYNATKFVGNGTTGVFKTSISVSGVVSRSFYLKSVTGTTTAVFKEPNTNVPSPITLTITNEWQRFEMTGDNGSSFQGLQIDDITSDGLFMWGAQLEVGSFPNSYIPTNGSTVTRLQDAAFGAGSSDLINSTEGVLYAEIAALANDSTNRAIALSDGSTSNVVRFYYSTTDNRIVGNLKSGGTTFFNFNNVLSSATDFLKVAISYKLNEFKMYVNGTLVFTDTSGNTPIGLSELAFDNGAGNDKFFGKTKCVAVFKEALTDAELTCLTTI